MFEIGKKYTFSALRINNTLFDLYTVNSREWILKNEEYKNIELKKVINKARNKGIYGLINDNTVVKKALATKSFMNKSIDVAMIVTVSDIAEDSVNSVYDVYFSDVSIIKGKVPDYILSEGVRIKDKVIVGNTYLMMFTQDEDGDIFIAAKENAVIDTCHKDYNNYLEALGVI